MEEVEEVGEVVVNCQALEEEEVEERYTLWEALEVVVEESVFQAYCHNLMKQKEETMLLEINAIHSS